MSRCGITKVHLKRYGIHIVWVHEARWDGVEETHGGAEVGGFLQRLDRASGSVVLRSQEAAGHSGVLKRTRTRTTFRTQPTYFYWAFYTQAQKFRLLVVL